MELPGRLRATTLGDLLGALHRQGTSGTLEMVEPSGRTHRVHLTSGAVSAVELDRASPSLAEILRRNDEIDDATLRRSLLRALASRRLHGEVLVRDFHLAQAVVDRALRQQLMLRLSALELLPDAQLAFRVTLRPPRGALTDRPLAPAEFLAGRRRARDASPKPSNAAGARAHHAARGRGERHDSDGAYATLGVVPGAAADDIKRAYRRLVLTLHPDLHPDANSEERAHLASRFAAVTAAYRALVA